MNDTAHPARAKHAKLPWLLLTCALGCSLLLSACGGMPGPGPVKGGEKVNETTALPEPARSGPVDIHLVFAPGTEIWIINAARRAEARWEKVFNAPLERELQQPIERGCMEANPGGPLQDVDGIVILISSHPIDGVGNVSAQGGPCLTRPNGTVLSGQVMFDSARDPTLPLAVEADVATHEMGHVLGIGSLWKKLVSTDASGVSRLTSPEATRQYQRAGGSGSPRIAADTNHWNAGMGRELMTAESTDEGNPMSAVTLGALADLGYGIDLSQAEAYRVPASAR